MLALRHRFEALPFDTTRVGRHLAAGHIPIGNFLQTCDRLFQAEVLARPASRKLLARGDAETYVVPSRGGVLDGTQISWVVSAVVDGTALLTVKVFHPTDGAAEHSVAFDTAARVPADGFEHKDPALAALFAPATPAATWQAHRHLLDLWDWNVGLPHGPSGVTVSAHDELEGAWLVSTPTGSFEWTPVGRRNVVAPASGRMPSEDVVRSLFLTPPEIQQPDGRL